MRQLSVIGRVVATPELRSAPSGTQVVNFSLATNRKQGDKDIVEYTRCSAFNQQATWISERFKKGDTVMVQGPLQTRKWKDGGGVERVSEEVVTNYFQFLHSPREMVATDQSETSAEDAAPPE